MAMVIPTLSTTPWRPRTLYFFIFLWISVVGGRFLALVLEQQNGLSATQVGSILALSQCITVWASSWTGSWADRLHLWHEYGRAMVLSVGILLGGVVFLGHYTTPIFLQPVLWHGFLRVCFAIANAMVFPVLDGMCLDYLRHSTTQDFGKERLWGAVSWGIANLIMAWFLDKYGFWILVPMAMGSTLLSLIAIVLYCASQNSSTQSLSLEKRDSNLVLPDDDDYDDGNHDDEEYTFPRSIEKNERATNEDKEQTGDEQYADLPSQKQQEPTTMSTISILYYLFCSSWFGAAFCIAQITQSSGQAIVDNLIFLYFEVLGSSYKLMGWTVVLTVAFEIPIFHLAPYLLKRWGPAWLIPVASLSYIVRVVGYSLIPQGQVQYVLWLEPLHGVTYACMATAAVELVSNYVITDAPGLEASAQSALQVLVGSGSVIGLVGGGWLEDVVGPRIMYRISASVVTFGCVLFTIALFKCPPAPTRVSSGSHSGGSSTKQSMKMRNRRMVQHLKNPSTQRQQSDHDDIDNNGGRMTPTTSTSIGMDDDQHSIEMMRLVDDAESAENSSAFP